MALVHHHFLYKAQGISRTDLGADAAPKLRAFMYDLLKAIDMKELIAPQFRFSEHKAWTGLMGIVTSHIAFHYWTVEQALQLDIYSCKPFDQNTAKTVIADFWQPEAQEALFMKREFADQFDPEILVEKRA